jgi:hypothetical protein
MAIRTEDRTIGEFTYHASQVPALEGRRAFARLARLLGPALAAMATGQGADVGGALGRLVENLKDEDMDYFCDLFGKHCTVDYPKGRVSVGEIFPIHFAGNYGAMMKWVLFNLELNFGSFFDEMGLRLRAPQAPAAE